MFDSGSAPEVAGHSCYVVLCTAPDPDTAARLARAWVQERVAACVNVVPAVTSYYRWEGEVQEDSELLLVAKTDGEHLQPLLAAITESHPYECPEAIALPIVAGAAAYLEWVTGELG